MPEPDKVENAVNQFYAVLGGLLLVALLCCCGYVSYIK